MKNLINILILFNIIILGCEYGRIKTKNTENHDKNKEKLICRKEYMKNSLKCDSIIQLPIGYKDIKTDSITDIVFSKWQNEIFTLLKTKYKIDNFNCVTGCDGFKVVIQFYVDRSGKLVVLKFFNDYLCNKPFSHEFKADFLDSFKNLILPESFRGKCYEYGLGPGILNC